MTNLQKCAIGFATVSLVFLAAMFSWYQTTQSQIPVVTQPFGGRASLMIPCTCSLPNVNLVVGPPRPIVVVRDPASVVYLYNVTAPPAWQLGLGSEPPVCLVWAGKVCVPVQPFPTHRILIDGTSMF